MSNKEVQNEWRSGTIHSGFERQKTGVLLSLKRYQRLMEDLHDLAVVAERRKEKSVSLEEMKRQFI